MLCGPSTFTFAARPTEERRLGPGEALVRVLAGGICGSDLPLFRGAPVPASAGSVSPPFGYPMHEIVGCLEAVGPGTVAAAPLGTRVVGWATRFDGLATEVITDAASIAPCPNRWSPEDVVLIQPLRTRRRPAGLHACGHLGPRSAQRRDHDQRVVMGIRMVVDLRAGAAFCLGA